MYAWTIVKGIDITEGQTIVGPRNATLDSKAIRRHPKRVRFRLLDDDSIVYAEGYLVGGCGFEPLDDYGMPALGATEIQHFVKGKGGGWQTV